MKRGCSITFVGILALAGAILPSASRAETPTPLFNGKDLDGWKIVNGGAKYHVEGDCVVGVVDPDSRQNTFLRTEKTYRNFRLDLDAKLDVPGNSGIQIRSHQKPGENGRVFGYQCEIDPSPRAWTAGIYDEARRGWLYPLEGHPEAQKAFKLDGWNHFAIEARGPFIKTWVNGVPCADLVDTMDDEGFIALQVHQGKAGQIRWKNILLTEYPDSAWKPAWDGKTLAGWSPSGGGRWSVDEGTIRGQNTADDKRHGHLFSSATAANFALKLQFLANSGDSGVYFRAEEGGPSGVKGLQVNIDPAKDTGGLYEIDGRGWLAQPKAADLKKWLKPKDWNSLSLVASGGRVVVHLNGFKTTEVADVGGMASGAFALQVHGGQDVDIRFKDIEILALPNVTDAKSAGAVAP